MSEQVVGYCVRVCDCTPDGWHKGVKILHAQEFLARQEDFPGDQLGNALRRAEIHAQHLEQQVWPNYYVEVEPIWWEHRDSLEEDRPA